MPWRSLLLSKKTMGKSKLLTALRTEIRRLGYSYKTEQAYTNWVTRFVHFHNLTHPKNMSETKVVEYLNYLATERNVAASTFGPPFSSLGASP